METVKGRQDFDEEGGYYLSEECARQSKHRARAATESGIQEGIYSRVVRLDSAQLIIGENMEREALGLIECRGLVAMIEAANAD